MNVAQPPPWNHTQRHPHANMRADIHTHTLCFRFCSADTPATFRPSALLRLLQRGATVDEGSAVTLPTASTGHGSEFGCNGSSDTHAGCHFISGVSITDVSLCASASQYRAESPATSSVSWLRRPPMNTLKAHFDGPDCDDVNMPRLHLCRKPPCPACHRNPLGHWQEPFPQHNGRTLLVESLCSGSGAEAVAVKAVCAK